MNFSEIIQYFQSEMLKNGINPPADILADSQLHRFYIKGDKSGSKNGWYVLFMDGLPGGIFGNWKTGITSTVCSKKPGYMNRQELLKHKQQVNDAHRQRKAEQAMEQAKAAKLAEKIWCQCTTANSKHPYLVKKQIPPFYARQSGKYLVLPIINISGDFSSLQFIGEDGSKRFLSNGKITGNYIPIQKQPLPDIQIMIAESYSTAGSIAQAYPNVCVIAACHASNLKPVAMNVRQLLPNSKMILCSDDDRELPVNIGLIKAREAAVATKALFAKPEWPAGAPRSLTDFNDLACFLNGSGVAI